MSERLQRSALSAGFAQTGLTLEQVWVRYFALGGTGDLADVEACLAGLPALDDDQHDLLAHTVNERLDELAARHRVPYARAVRPGRTRSAAFAALAALIEDARTAPPERLPELAAAAGRSVRADVTIHRIDHEHRSLVQLGAAGPGPAPRLGLDGTMAGRAFRTVQVVAADSGDPRLWVPLLDGAARLGVLEVGVETSADLYDPTLREQCWSLASLLALLLNSMETYGDSLAQPRRSHPLSPSAELVWRQLPPLAAATDTFEIAGRVEPSYYVGGDAFDYALSETSVAFGIFDAVGHGMHAALMSTAALAAYRTTRRDDRGVFDQARAVDDVISESFLPGSAFLTGVLAELDVRSGRLRYVNAGHPPPLLLRGGRVVKELRGGRRLPFGLDNQGLTVGEEVLQPGDSVCLYTDGITEARDAGGTWFGETRLAEMLGRSILSGRPAAETVRRLTAAVLEHQNGLLLDDAAVVLARWKKP